MRLWARLKPPDVTEAFREEPSQRPEDQSHQHTCRLKHLGTTTWTEHTTQKCHTYPRQQAQTLSLFSLVIFEVRIIETKPETEKRAAMLAPRTNLSYNKTSTDKMWKWFQLEFIIYDTKLQLKSYKKGFVEAKLIVPSVDGVSSPSSVSHIKPLMRKINLLGEEECSETFLHDKRDMWPNTEQHNNPMTFGMEWIRQCSHKHSHFFQHK